MGNQEERFLNDGPYAFCMHSFDGNDLGIRTGLSVAVTLENRYNLLTFLVYLADQMVLRHRTAWGDCTSYTPSYSFEQKAGVWKILLPSLYTRKKNSGNSQMAEFHVF